MPAPGTVLQGRYRVERELGHGGMGAVYEATDLKFGSAVALKRRTVTGDTLGRAFEREARILNSLRHAALPHVIDHFAEAGGQFLVMQFIPGHDLGHLLERNGGPLPWAEVLGCADQLLDALEYLHGHEPPIVHRDIKPQNLKLTPRGEIILLDFGLSKGLPGSSQLAGGGSVSGYTPSYAPFEQVQGAGTDPRSDLYSLAATLWTLVAGRFRPIGEPLELRWESDGPRPAKVELVVEGTDLLHGVRSVEVVYSNAD